MKRLASLLLALTVSTAGIAAAAAAPSMQERHDAVASQVNATIGADTAPRVKPFVDDAQGRIIAAVHDAGAHQKSPMQILTFGQKMALRRARHAGTEPDIDLTPEQRTQLTAYVAAVAGAVAPIVREEGTKIDGLLTPAQRASLDALRLQTRDAMRALPHAGAMRDLAGAIMESGFADTGSFVLLAELDPKAIASALR